MDGGLGAYTTDRGLAIILYDTDESQRFKPNALRLADALRADNFEVLVEPASGIIARVNCALARPGFLRFTFAFCGHGGLTAGLGSQGVLWDSDGAGNSLLIPVTWIIHAAAAAYPGAAVPKIFILDCCFSADARPCTVPPGFTVDPGRPGPRDWAILRCASPGYFGYVVAGRSYSVALATALDQHRGFPGFHLLRMHAEAVRLLQRDALFDTAAPFVSSDLGLELFLTKPDYRHDSVLDRHVPWRAVTDAMERTPEGPGGVFVPGGASGGSALVRSRGRACTDRGAGGTSPALPLSNDRSTRRAGAMPLPQ